MPAGGKVKTELALVLVFVRGRNTGLQRVSNPNMLFVEFAFAGLTVTLTGAAGKVAVAVVVVGLVAVVVTIGEVVGAGARCLGLLGWRE